MTAYIDVHDAVAAVAYDFDPTLPSLAPTIALPALTRVDVSFDVDRKPYVMVQVTAARPAPEVMAKLDPREFPALRVDLTATNVVTGHLDALVSDVTADFPAALTSALTAAAGALTSDLSGLYPGEDVETILSDVAPSALTIFPIITDVAENITDDTITISAASTEILLDYWANMSPVPVDMSGYGPSTLSIAFEVVRRVGLNMGFTTTGAETIPPTADAMLWQPGQSARDFLDGLLEFNDLRIYSSAAEAPSWRISPSGTTIEDFGSGTINLDYRTGMTNATRALSSASGRNEYYDSVLITYRWRDAAGVDQLAFDRYPNGGTYRKTLSLKRDRAYPGPGAAMAIYRRSINRGGDYTVSNVSRYDVRPGWDSTLLLPGDAVAKATLIKSIEWSLPLAEMNIRLELKEAA